MSFRSGQFLPRLAILAAACVCGLFVTIANAQRRPSGRSLSARGGGFQLGPYWVTGSLGGAAIGKLAPLGPHIIGVNRHGKPVEGCSQVVTIAELDSVLPNADYLYLAVPDTPETTHWRRPH